MSDIADIRNRSNIKTNNANAFNPNIANPFLVTTNAPPSLANYAKNDVVADISSIISSIEASLTSIVDFTDYSISISSILPNIADSSATISIKNANKIRLISLEEIQLSTVLTTVSGTIKTDTLFANYINVQNLNFSTASGSTIKVFDSNSNSMNSDNITAQTINATYINMQNLNFSTASGSTIKVFDSNSNSMNSDNITAQTLTASTLTASTLNFSKATGSTITINNQVVNSTLSVSTLFSQFLNVSSLSGSIISTDILSVNSTLNVTMLNANPVTISTDDINIVSAPGTTNAGLRIDINGIAYYILLSTIN